MMCDGASVSRCTIASALAGLLVGAVEHLPSPTTCCLPRCSRRPALPLPSELGGRDIPVPRRQSHGAGDSWHPTLLQLSLALPWPAQRCCPLQTVVACPAFRSTATSPPGEGSPPAPAAPAPPLLFPGHPSPSFPPCPLCQLFAFAPPLPQPLKWLRFDFSPTFYRRVWCAGCLPEVVHPEVVTPVDVCSANAAFIFRSKRRESLRRGEDAAFTMRPAGAFPQIRTIDGSAVPRAQPEGPDPDSAAVSEG